MEDILGRNFGKLSVISLVDANRHAKWNRFIYRYECECECGNRCVVIRSNLVTGHTNSCGCLKKRVGLDNPSYRGVGQLSGRLWSSIVGKAKLRDLKLAITRDQAWDQFQNQHGKCALTGIQLSFGSDKTASLDRIDNAKGYEAGNIQWVHKDINWMKGTYSTERFVELCRLVSDHERGG